MIYLFPAILIATVIMAGLLMYQGAFRVEPEPNELPMKNRRIGRLTVDIPAMADKVDNWLCTLVVDRDLSLLHLEEIVIDRLAEGDDKSGRLDWELDILVRKEKDLSPGSKWKEICLENKFDRPARFIIGRAWLDWERVNYAFWMAFPGGFLKISGLPLLIHYEKVSQAEAARQLEQGQARFQGWVDKVLADYHWLGGLDEPAPVNTFRTRAGYFDGELSRAHWNVSASFKSTSPSLAFWAMYDHDPDPCSDVLKVEEFLKNRFTFLLLRIFRGLAGDHRDRPRRNSFKTVLIDRVPGLEYIIFEYDANDRPYLSCSWEAKGRHSAGRPNVQISAVTDSHNSSNPIELEDIPAVLGIWQAMLQSVRWPKD